MSSLLSTAELRAMPVEDLHKEILRHQAVLAKIRMDLELGKEKNSAKYSNERRAVARMKTIESEKMNGVTMEKKMPATKAKKEVLKTERKPSKVRAPKNV